MPVSARTGEGLDGCCARRCVSLARLRCRARRTTVRVRLPIDRVFSMQGFRDGRRPGRWCRARSGDDAGADRAAARKRREGAGVAGARAPRPLGGRRAARRGQPRRRRGRRSRARRHADRHAAPSSRRGGSTCCSSCCPASPLRARRAGPVPSRHERAARAGRGRDGRARRRADLRADPARIAGRRDARRSVHPSRLLAACDRSAAASCSTRSRRAARFAPPPASSRSGAGLDGDDGRRGARSFRRRARRRRTAAADARRQARGLSPMPTPPASLERLVRDGRVTPGRRSARRAANSDDARAPGSSESSKRTTRRTPSSEGMPREEARGRIFRRAPSPRCSSWCSTRLVADRRARRPRAARAARHQVSLSAGRVARPARDRAHLSRGRSSRPRNRAAAPAARRRDRAVVERVVDAAGAVADPGEAR